MSSITVDRLVSELGFEIDTKDLDKFVDKTDTAEKKSKGFGISLTSMAKTGAAAFAAVGAAAAAAAVAMVKNFADTGDRLIKMADQFDVSVEGIQQWEYAAERSGVEAGLIKESFKKLQVGLEELRTKGTGPAAEGMAMLGLEASDLEGLDTELQLLKIADAVARTGDESTKTAGLAKLLGETAGPEMKKLLGQGAAGVQPLLDRLSEMPHLTRQNAEDAAVLQDQWLDIKTIFTGVANTIGAGLAPVAEDLGNRILELVKQNENFISQDLPEFIATIAEATIELLPLLVDFVKNVKDIVEWTQGAVKATRELSAEYPMVGKAISALGDTVGTLVWLLGQAIDKFDELAKRGDVIGNVARRVNAALGRDSESRVYQKKVSSAAAPSVQEAEFKRDGPGVLGVHQINDIFFANRMKAKNAGRVKKIAAGDLNSKQLKAIMSDPNASNEVRAVASQAYPAKALAEQQGLEGVYAGIAALQGAQAARAKKTEEDAGLDGGDKDDDKPPKGGGGGKKKPPKPTTLADTLAGALGVSKGSFGAGASALEGSSWVRVDASLTDNSQTTIVVRGSKATPDEIARIVVEQRGKMNRKYADRASNLGSVGG